MPFLLSFHCKLDSQIQDKFFNEKLLLENAPHSKTASGRFCLIKHKADEINQYRER